jgi:hypothetical protein
VADTRARGLVAHSLQLDRTSPVGLNVPICPTICPTADLWGNEPELLGTGANICQVGRWVEVRSAVQP